MEIQEDIKAAKAAHAKTCQGWNISDNALANNMRQLCSKLCDVVNGWQQKCLQYEGTLAAQQEEIDRLKGQWEEHTKHVGRFLTEMYQTMIDPLDEPEPSLKIAELCEMLLNQAREDREKLNRSPFNWPADWNKDSSLETWFPLTAEELTRIKAENAKLQARLDAMSAPVSEFMGFVCGFGCAKCAAGKPVLKNSCGFWSHREEGNYCSNHSIYEAYEKWKTARAKTEATG